MRQSSNESERNNEGKFIHGRSSIRRRDESEQYVSSTMECGPLPASAGWGFGTYVEVVSPNFLRA
jgi:hypothetical protein